MAKSAGIVEGEIREGLMCPHCYCDFVTVDRLKEHFEFAHSTEDHDTFQSLKGFLGKAKRKILKQDTWSEDINKSYFEPSPVHDISSDLPSWSDQEIGLTSSHTQNFKSLREKKINRYVFETNKLLIRLDKLVTDIADEPEKRKEFEKTIVPWVPDSDVPLCPGCAKSFKISRRRHHCRLCGGVMCHSCSYFMTYEFARKLTLPVMNDEYRAINKQKPVPRRASSASIMTSMSMSGGEQLIRVCKDCNVLLQRHDKLMEQRKHRPDIVVLYEKLREFTDEVEKLIPLYLEMTESLNLGETEYQHEQCVELHTKIYKFAGKIDAQSKRILKLEADAQDSNSKFFQLQNGIRMSATQFIRNNVSVLPLPPTPEKIAHYRNVRQEQVHRRIQLQKQAEILSNKRESSKSPSPVATSKKQIAEPISPDTGWCVSSGKVKDDEDPMLQQINIIHKYIKQAKMDHKYDEVKILENNLEELQREFQKQQSLS
ncbi:rabenosyn-5-like [Uloborus diversus]|uniref:rabenosyn-5-like n=1 Tax=Uloborus diversus TaxID=327109 RepID=UPI00240A358B|nr:rabenosyn-5-like [Uloborus diversus]XP_054716897.1 rabenosyn-5-like [Uloborus diversus]XP_054716903.1 rabenosyn-5-like [Uloborus diversus]